MGTQRILFVGFERESLRRIQRQLATTCPHLSVITAPDGVAGLRQYIRWDPVAVVAHQFMTAMNGAALVREIRSVDPGIPIVLICSGPHAKDGSGVTAFLQTRDLDQLPDLLHRLLREETVAVGAA